MLITRRSFLATVLAAAATTAGIIGSPRVAEALLFAPEDPIKVVVARLIEIDNLTKNDAIERDFVGREIDDLLGFMLDTFTVLPHDDDVHALCYGLVDVDIFDEVSLRLIGEPLVPIAVARTLIRSKYPCHIGRALLPNFHAFSVRYKGSIINSALSPEYEAFFRKHQNTPVAERSRAYLEYRLARG